jgi:hypothetical protein
MFKRTDYSNPDNYAPVFNILTATTGESSEYNPNFEIFGSVIRSPLLNNIETEEDLNQIAARYANNYTPVWTMFNKNSKYFPVIFYKIPGLSYPFNISESVSNINTGFLEEYIHQITTNENINLITNHQSFSDNKESIYTDGLKDEWLTYGRDDLNTGYMASNIIRPANALAMEVEKASSLLPTIDKQTYTPVFDTTHIYANIVGLDSNKLGFCLNGSGVLVKIDKITGVLEKSITAAEIFKNITTDIHKIDTRSPPELTNDYLYISTCPTNADGINAIAKLRKSDLSIIWTYETFIGNKWESGRNIKVVNPNPKHMPDHLKGKTILVQAISVGKQYGFDSTSSGYRFNYDYNWWIAQGGCLALVDHGNYAESLWNFTAGPKMLQQGDIIPIESFVEGETSMVINYPLVDLITDGILYDSTNYIDDSGTKGFKIDSNTSGEVTFDFLNDNMTKVIATYPFTLTEGMILLNNDTKYYSNDGNPLHYVTGKQIFQGQNIIKTVYVGEVINNPFDAMDLNYFGSGSWGTMTYDDVTGTFYLPTAQGHKQPLNDSKSMSAQSNLTELAEKYEETVNNYYKDPPTNPPTTVQDVEKAYKNYENYIPESKKIKRSPRWTRFFVDGIVALDLGTGQIKWFDSPYIFDSFYWLQVNRPKFNNSRPTGFNGDNVSGATIVTLSDKKTRRIFTSDKGAHVSYYNADDNSYYIEGNPYKNYENGIIKMVPPQPTYITAGIAGFQGGSVFGSCSDGEVYITHQTNIPIGSDLLVKSDNQSDDNSILLNNVYVGYITDKVIPNDQSVLIDFPDNKKLIRALNGYLIGIDCTTGKKKWVCPLSSTLDVLNLEEYNLNKGVPGISDNGPVRQFGNVAVVGLASGKVHFVDAQTGQMLKTMAFAAGAAMGVSGTEDSLYLLSGWNKWFNSNGKYKTLPTSKHMNFLTINGI